MDDERLNEDAGLPPLGEEPSGKRLLRLRTAGGFIVDELGTGFNLRGVSILGLDAASPGADQSLRDALSLDDANLTALSNWSINVVRLPFLAATVMSGNGTLTAASILAGLDDLVAALVATKTYTLLSLQAPITPGAVVAALPDQTTFDAWSLLAARYANETGVLFEIYSSPLPISGDWLDAVQMLIGAIRSRHPASLLFAGGGAGGSDVTGLPLRFSTGDPTPNIVSTIRVAAGRQLPSDEHALAALAESFPVVATDWSAAEASSLDRAPELAANTFARLGIGWVAGNWNGDPRLVVASQSHGMTPTRWGTTVARAVTLPQRLPLEKLLPDATST
ncbi:MAG: cellulase family glycosylhydrolase [Candidatus Tumulicola sp.]